MSEWKEITISEIAEGIYDGPHATPKKTSSGAVFLGISNLRNGNIDLSNAEYLSEKDFVKWTKRIQPKYNDLVFAYETRLGEAALIPKDLRCCLGRRMGLIRPNINKIYPHFLLYKYLSSDFQDTIRSRTIYGSTVNRIALKEFPGFPIKIPSLEEQKAIADVLSCLDGKIENLRRQNETLEAIAQTLFKHWFMDFEFPNEDGKPYKSSGGAMIPSELGEIPEGWRVGTLGDEFDISIGKTPPRKEKEWFSLNSQDIRWISIKDMRKSGVFINQTSEFLTRTSIDKFNIRIIPDNTVILSFKLTVGRVAITMGEMTSNEAIAHIKNKLSYISSEYIYLFFKRFNFDKLGSTSSIATAVNSKTIKSIKLILPTKTIIDSFSESVKPIFNKVRNNQKQIQTLTKTRDTLLPKLMSGQLRVKEQKL